MNPRSTRRLHLKTLFTLMVYAFLCSLGMAEEMQPQLDVFFEDSFERRDTGNLPEEVKAGAGGKWQRIGEPIDSDGRIYVTSERTAGDQSKQSLRFFKPNPGSKLSALGANLRLPYRREAYASMDVFFDKTFTGKTNALTLSLSQPNAARIARLIMKQDAGSDIVTLDLEDGADAERVKTVGTIAAGEWIHITWGVDSGRNAVTLIVNGKILLDTHTVVPQKAATERNFAKASLSKLIFYPNEAASVFIDNFRIDGISPLTPPAEPARIDYAKEEKEGVMCVDFFDLAYIDALMNGNIYNKEQIRQLLTDCKAAGITTVLWRLTACGTVLYRSEVQNWDTFRNDKRPPAHAAADIMDSYDHLWEACKVAHEVGIKVFAWIDLYDDGVAGSPHYSRLLAEHPEYQWVDRSGKHYIGIPSYAFKEARKFRVDMIKEVMGYPVDGLFLCFRTHATATPENKGITECGFEAPVVEEYQKRYGVDIRNEEFDRKKWHDLKGEFLTTLLREVRSSIHKEMPVWIDLVSNQGDGPTTRTQHALDFKTWHEEGLVQGISICGPRIQSGKAYENSGELVPIQEGIISKYQPLREMGFSLYYFASVDQQDKCKWDYIPTILRNLKGTPFQGMAIMEAYRFQLGDHRWKREGE